MNLHNRKLVFILTIVLLLSVALVSASSFSDWINNLFGKNTQLSPSTTGAGGGGGGGVGYAGSTNLNFSISPATSVDGYQVKILLTQSNFDYSKIDPTGSSIRFYDSSGTNLPYWIEQWNYGGNSIIWVRIAKAGTNQIKLQYSPDVADSTSNAKDTFELFDDFGYNVNWTREGNTGEALLSYADSYTVVGVRNNQNAAADGAWSRPISLKDNVAVEARMKMTRQSLNFGFYNKAANVNSSSRAAIVLDRDAYGSDYWAGGNDYQQITGSYAPLNKWVRVGIGKVGAQTYIMRDYSPGVVKEKIYYSSPDINSILIGYQNYGNGQGYFDYVFVRKFVYPEPVTSLSSSSPVCGNGVIEAGEQCDDGNTINGDGCSSTCQTETITTPVCIDSDGGLNYYVKGYVNSSLVGNVEDYCSNANPGQLDERSCNRDGTIADTYYQCSNGCYNGACLYAMSDEITLSVGDTVFVKDTSNHKVNLDYVDQNHVKLNVDGEETNSLGIGTPYYMSNGIIVNVSDIIYVSKETVKSRAIFSLRTSNTTTPVNMTCTDSDGGLNYYVKGTAIDKNGATYTDSCVTGDNSIIPVQSSTDLEEYTCQTSPGAMGLVGSNRYSCPNGCLNGACINRTVPTGECGVVLDRIKNPQSFVFNDLQFNFGWNWTSLNNPYWTNNDNKEHFYDDYYTGYYVSYSPQTNEQYSYQDIGYEAMIFHDNIDLNSILKDLTSYQLCVVQQYWDSENKQNNIYICNWDVLNNQQSTDSYQSKSRQLFWVNNNNNMVVRMSIYEGDQLTDAQLIQLAQSKLVDFVNSLKDNSAKYVSWDNFNLDYPVSSLIYSDLANCPSNIPSPVINNTNVTCYPSWSCKTEPVVCPEYGTQKRTCTDYSCGQTREDVISCSPGICSGCYEPRWLGSNDNICIPYGFRFQHQSGEEIKLQEVEQNTTISENIRGGYALTVISENKAIFTIYGVTQNYTYTLTPGATVEITIPDYGSEIQKMTLIVNNIYFSSKVGVDSYVDLTVRFKYLGKIVNSINAYCDIDGRIKAQKTRDANNNWASCQNNYECVSNVCSSGECVDVNALVQQGSSLKKLLVRILCRLDSLFSNTDYNQCLANYN